MPQRKVKYTDSDDIVEGKIHKINFDNSDGVDTTSLADDDPNQCDILRAYTAKQKKLYKKSELHQEHSARIMSLNANNKTQVKKTVIIDGVTYVA